MIFIKKIVNIENFISWKVKYLSVFALGSAVEIYYPKIRLWISSSKLQTTSLSSVWSSKCGSPFSLDELLGAEFNFTSDDIVISNFISICSYNRGTGVGIPLLWEIGFWIEGTLGYFIWYLLFLEHPLISFKTKIGIRLSGFVVPFKS